ncbi:MAG: nuclear transport factor 2 family protein [Pseudomonadota bacterium]
MTPAAPTEREAVLLVLHRLAEAHRDRDAEAIVACHEPGAVLYDLAPPLATGLDASSLSAWLATWAGPIGIEMREAEVAVGGDVAWAAALTRMTGVKKDGEEIDIWFRSTSCLRRRGGDWRIAHGHASTPFHMDGSYKAAVELTPDPG